MMSNALAELTRLPADMIRIHLQQRSPQQAWKRGASEFSGASPSSTAHS